MAKVTEPTAEQKNVRVDEAKKLLDEKIERYIAIYNAVTEKVTGEHMQAAIFAAVIAEE